MKKMILAVAGGTVAFLLGFGGIYFAMPLIAPERVEKTQHQIDSLQALTRSIPDSTLMAMAVLDPDSLARAALQAHALALALDSARQTLSAQGALVEVLEDSLHDAYQRIQSIETAQSGLIKKIEGLLQRLEALEGQRVEVKDLSAVIPKLEDKDLAALVAQLDLTALKMLYTESSGRNRSRLLQAMNADRAARFVSSILGITTPDTPLPSPPDTMAISVPVSAALPPPN